MLAARAASEVRPREQNRRALIAGLIEHEAAIDQSLVRRLSHRTFVEKPPRVEQVVAEAGPADLLQELLRDYLIRIDVCAVEWNYGADQQCEWFHLKLRKIRARR